MKILLRLLAEEASEDTRIKIETCFLMLRALCLMQHVDLSIVALVDREKVISRPLHLLGAYQYFHFSFSKLS